MPNRPDIPDYEFSPPVIDGPYWKNDARICTYFSEVHQSLGCVRLGEGAARHTWFSYVGNDTEPITPGGRADREAAKSDVVRMAEIAVGLMVVEQEYRVSKGGDDED